MYGAHLLNGDLLLQQDYKAPVLPRGLQSPLLSFTTSKLGSHLRRTPSSAIQLGYENPEFMG
ncbi:hypothetical protein C0J52_18536 [Blattella germanica]|nr:hypothetical protein C0J52_18536 [Blattella germanica]